MSVMAYFKSSAVQADAASHVDFKGYYRVYYNNTYNLGAQDEGAAFTDSYFAHRLHLEMTFRPTDEIAVYWNLRGPAGARFGNADNGLTTRFVYGEIKQDWGTVVLGRIDDNLDMYGLASLGYQPGDHFRNWGPFDNAGNVDAIRWSNRWDNGFQLMGQYVKLNNNRVEGGSTWAGNDPADGRGNRASDQDYDRYQVEGAYFWDGGGASLNVIYDRNANGGNYIGRDRNPGWVNGRWDDTADLNYTTAWFINPAIMHSWGDFSVHFEGMAGWGKYHADNTRLRGANRWKDTDAEGYGFYLDADYNYGPGNVMLAGWYTSGSDLSDTKDKGLVDIVQGNFYPLLVAYSNVSLGTEARYDARGEGNELTMVGVANNAFVNFIQTGYNNNAFIKTNYGATGTANMQAIVAGLMNDVGMGGDTNMIGAATPGGNFQSKFQAGADGNDRTRTLSFNEGKASNHWAIAVAGNHAFTDDISMNYGLGYLALTNPNYRIAKSATVTNTGANVGNYRFHEQDKDLGFEIDLGFRFQLLDNLTFHSTFGYMINGDAYKSLKGYRLVETGVGEGRIEAVWEDPKNTYIWANTLQFDF